MDYLSKEQARQARPGGDVLRFEPIPDSSPTLIIQPGSLAVVNTIGDAFYITEATGPVRIECKFIGARSYLQGQGKELPAGYAFEVLEVFNDTDEAITCTIDISFGRSIDNRMIIAPGAGVALATYEQTAHALTVDSLAASPFEHSEEVVFDPSPFPGYIKRQSVTISNKSIAASILILDEDDKEQGFVPPNTLIELTHQSFFKLLNDSGEAIDCKAWETWTVSPGIIL
jgi:hypothetical protein